ncbi:class II aldolase and Adducin N-terminal domain-containing protein [Xylariomycetidae sp. FL2044]|nr:class II aldolase and Adducin N-terminal domain-containing protein [Xylariomycetidae sp. FL2044]
MANITQLLGTFITGLHILHYNGVLDAYGHMAVRNPDDPSTFFMSRNLPPALAFSRDDIVEYRVSDASPVAADAPNGFIERYIHSEILKRFGGVNVVVHSHSPSVVSYSIADVPLEPSIHLAGFLGTRVPIFDISKYYASNDTQDLLLRSARLGAALAAEFSEDPEGSSVDHDVVLMQSHGFTTVAADVETAVFKAIYTQINAQVQTDAMGLQRATRLSGTDRGIVYLTEKQARESWETNMETIQRPYSLWVRQVKVSPLYANELDP